MLFDAPYVGDDAATTALIARNRNFQHFIERKWGGDNHGGTADTAARARCT